MNSGNLSQVSLSKRCPFGHKVLLAPFRKLVGNAFMMQTKGQEKRISYVEWVTKKRSLQ